jgi:hypothetical protein
MPRDYTDAVRRVDADILSARSNDEIVARIPAKHLYDALCVFILDEELRPVLEILSPKAVQQARAALLLT